MGWIFLTKAKDLPLAYHQKHPALWKKTCKEDVLAQIYASLDVKKPKIQSTSFFFATKNWQNILLLSVVHIAMRDDFKEVITHFRKTVCLLQQEYQVVYSP